MGERRAFALALSLMPCVSYVHVASECYEGRLNCWFQRFRLNCRTNIKRCWKYICLLWLAVWQIC